MSREDDFTGGEDPLGQFPAEGHPRAQTECVEPPAISDVDALIDAVSAGGVHRTHVPTNTTTPHSTSPTTQAFRLGPRFSPVLKRWVVPAAAAFVIGVLAGLWGFQTRDVLPAAPVIARRPVPERTLTTVLPSTPVANGIGIAPSLDVPTLPQPEASEPQTPAAAPLRPAPPPPATRPTSATASRATTSPAPTVGRPTAEDARSGPATEAPANATRTPSPAVVPPAVAAESAAPAALTSLKRFETPEPPAPAVAINRGLVTSERDAVLRILRDYEEAFEDLDVSAAAEVWPSVDRRALSRAFATLKSQGLSFVACDIAVVESHATASCDGSVEFVRRVGRPVPMTAQQRWVFKMRKIGTHWTIEEVIASPGEAGIRGFL